MGIANPEANQFGEPLWLTRNKASKNSARGTAAQVAAEDTQGRHMFRGNHPAKVEENGRLKLPVPFKQLLDAANVTDLYVTSEDGKRAQIWPLGEWEKIEAQLAKHSTMNDSVMRYLDLTSYYGQQVKVDAQGRIMLPQILRSTARLEGDLAVMGKITHLEVVNRSAFEQDLPTSTLSSDDRRQVGGILADGSKS